MQVDVNRRIVPFHWKAYKMLSARQKKHCQTFGNELLKSGVSTSTILTRNTPNTIGHYEYYRVLDSYNFMSTVSTRLLDVSQFTILSTNRFD